MPLLLHGSCARGLHPNYILDSEEWKTLDFLEKFETVISS